MCDMGLISVVIGLAGMGMSMAGQAMQGKAQKQQYRAAAKASDANRIMMREMSDDALKRGKEAALRRMAVHRQALANLRMRYRGIDSSMGSPIVAFDSLDLAAQRDGEMLIENSRRESWEYLERGKQYSAQAADYRAASSLVGASTAVGIATSVLQTGYQMTQYYGFGTPNDPGDLSKPIANDTRSYIPNSNLMWQVE
jgi:hypothetical protein